MKRTRPRAFLAVLLVAAVIAAGGVAVYLAGRASGPAVDEVDWVTLITIDTVRADHLGCYGYPRQTSPFIDELARSGARFERAFAPVGITAPSHASMFTALYPLQHRVLSNGHRLGDGQVTVAEVLKTMGFRTAAFVSVSRLFSGGNLHQGFGHFDEPPESVSPYRTADRTIDAVLGWLERTRPSGKLFLWIHLFDPHFPYRPPRLYLDRLRRKGGLTSALLREQHLEPQFYDRLHRFWTSADVNDPALAQQGRGRFGFDIQGYWKTIRPLTRGTKSGGELMARVVDAYDAEIAFVDAQLRRLYERVRNRAGRAGNLWIISGDHGEGLGSHHYLTHGKQIYNAQLHVPLIFSLTGAGGRSLPAKKLSTVVGLVDLFPTVLDLLGGSREQLEERVRRSGTGARIKGESLAPLLLGRGDDRVRGYALAQRKLPRRREGFDRLLDENGLLPPYLGHAFAVQDARFKYLLRTGGPDQLFDLKQDPHEQRNLIDDGALGAVARRLKAIILEQNRGMAPRGQVAPTSVDNETLKKLRSLGYVQ